MNLIAVDDEYLPLGYIVNMLRNLYPNCTVKGFEDPCSALDYAQETSVDVAFLDIEMYEMSGINLAKALRLIDQNIRIIFITAFPNYALDAFSVHANGYLLKPPTKEAIKSEMAHLNLPVPHRSTTIRIHTFGNFDVFIGGTPLSFSRSKSKELLAYLIDRNGSSATTSELISILWEDREFTTSIQRQFQTAASDLTKVLKKFGAEDLLIRKRNFFAVNTEKVDCDYFNFLKGDLQALNSYTGEYMNHYSWAELTNGLLSKKAKLH